MTESRSSFFTLRELCPVGGQAEQFRNGQRIGDQNKQHLTAFCKADVVFLFTPFGVVFQSAV